MKKDYIATVLRYIGIALCLFGIGICLYCLIDRTQLDGFVDSVNGGAKEYFFYITDIVTNMAVIAFGLTYLGLGYRKKDAKWYRLFMASFAAIIFYGFVASYFDNDPAYFMSSEYWVNHILNIGAYTACVILAVAKDLGRIRTFALLFVLTAIYLYFSLTSAEAETVLEFASFGIRLFMCFVGVIMAYDKYSDKKLRANAG